MPVEKILADMLEAALRRYVALQETDFDRDLIKAVMSEHRIWAGNPLLSTGFCSGRLIGAVSAPDEVKVFRTPTTCKFCRIFEGLQS